MKTLQVRLRYNPLIVLASIVLLIVAIVGWFVADLFLTIYTLDTFSRDLRATGATVETVPTEPEFGPLLPASRHTLRVNDELVTVYEFSDNWLAWRAARAVLPYGDGIAPIDGFGGVMLDYWAIPPHFYRKGQLIVLIGSWKNSPTKALVEKFLGAQFAGMDLE